MKIFVIYDLVDEPAGGGNQFIKMLKNEFKAQGFLAKTPKEADIFLFNSHHCLKTVYSYKKSFPEKKSLIKLRNGDRIGYAIYGNKKNFPIFYFHGWPGSRFELKNIPLKKKKCFIIALERPGYGISDPISKFKILDWPKIVLEVANKLKIKKFSIIGVSGGAPFALACANTIKNKRLKSIAIVCALAPSKAKGMNKGRVGMLLNFGRKPFISWLIFNFLRMRLLNRNLEKSFNKWKNKISLPEIDLNLFTIDRGKRLM